MDNFDKVMITLLVVVGVLIPLAVVYIMLVQGGDVVI